MSELLRRRRFLEVAAAASLSSGLTRGAAKAVDAPAEAPHASKPFLTAADNFFDVSRGNPRPWSLQGEAREKARLTPETWRLEIVSDGTADVASPHRLEDGTALDLAGLMAMGKTH